ncbi:DNA gyrase subunit A [Mycoplasmopsis maculosa]|uniref:DNA topoisomerase (ATP-hydrolyzing) n=1 Tax=Mycoplasmopsis maculosa TaxID=114885 RepID=A0A449B519_9BACT|nr:DNA topoisomerase IV subunit A [Mycoplasmopsis maculosa]VEU75669.1 DNA gyrase subunit A [Mycoplasmopsis maculosa]
MDKNKQNKLDNLLSKIIKENIDSIMSDRFSKYSKYVIQQRALPDVRDGLKPVQRRILYSMFDLGLQYNKPYKKSARVVGDVIGKYHPHGDSSIYDAMVRMAQDWKMGYKLLDMHGNVGSIDDDPAAAMRYTEARLAEISDYIIGDINKQTVKFAPNFDDSEKEPIVLPSLIPNLLVNGAVGIASGFATDMPPHNLNEVLDGAILKIKNPDAPFSKLFKIIKGPDFPTGGAIYGTSGIYEAFEKGKGKITLISKYKEYDDNKFSYIEIYEIPYGVIKSKLVHDIDVIISKNDVNGLLEVKDQSDRNGISILITLDKNANKEAVLNYLLAKTEMKIFYNYNNVVIENNSPKVLNLNQLLEAYLKHVKDIKIKTINFDLVKFKARLEIVLGFLKVSEITDKVIKVIRESENSKQGVISNLISTFDFTLNQATAIAELRLYKLSKTDKQAFLIEKEELEKNIRRCKLLLDNEEEFNKYLISVFEEIKKKFGRPRLTTIYEEEFKGQINLEDLVKEEEVFVSVTKNGYLKRTTTKVFESNDISNFALKQEDQILFYNKTNTLNNLLIFTSFGNYCIVPTYKISESKWKDFGVHLSDFVELLSNEEIVSVIDVNDFNVNNYVTLFSKEGQGKRVILSDFKVSRMNKTFTAIKLRENDKLIGAELTNGLKDVLLITKRGLANLYSENDVQIYGTKSNGTKSCYMPPIDELVSFACVENDEIITLIANNSLIKRINVNTINKVSKKNLGKPIFPQLKTKQIIVNNSFVFNKDLDKMIIQKDNENYSLVEENIKNYPITTIDEGFSKIKENDILSISIINNKISGNIKSNKIEYSQSTTKEKEIIKKAQEEINVLDMDIDAILAKFVKDKKK